VSSIDEIQRRVDALVLRRERLRQAGAGRATLERNRLQIVRANQQLSSALIAHFGGHAAAAA
jgi:hypothetical protein